MWGWWEEWNRYLLRVCSQPTRHPSQRHEAKEKKGAQIECGNGSVVRLSLADLGEEEELAPVEEDRVDLDDQGHHDEPLITTGQHGHSEAGYHLMSKCQVTIKMTSV